MNTRDKLVAAARRAARAHARDASIPYQKALDAIAVQHGRPTWSAFLADPMPINADAEAAAAEPDFTTIPARLQIAAAMRYGLSTGSTSLVAGPRAWADPRPVLSYGSPDGSMRSVDARGLDLPILAEGCRGERTEDDLTRIHSIEGMPGMEGLLRARSDIYMMGDDVTATASIGLDDAAPPAIARMVAPAEEPAKMADDTRRRRTPEMLPRRDFLNRTQRLAFKQTVARGHFSTTDGPLIGRVGRRDLRLPHGHHMMSFSPPGTGRMAAISLPALLSDDKASYVVHDDGQHLEITSGWRASIGRVAVIRVDGDSTDSINPFDGDWIPPHPGSLPGYVEQIMRTLVPDRPDLADMMARTALPLVERPGGATMLEIHAALAICGHPLVPEAVSALAPFITRAAQEACGRSTLTPADLRGRATENDRPLTLYLVRGVGMRSRLDPILAAIQTTIWMWSLSSGPGDDIGRGRRNGPLAVVSLLIDLHRLPIMAYLPKVMDLGRAKRTSVIVTGTAGAAITQRYGAETAREIVECCGMLQAIQQSDPGDLPFVDPYDQIGYGRLSQMPADKGYILTNLGAMPIEYDRTMFFRVPQLLHRAYNRKFGRGPRPVA